GLESAFGALQTIFTTKKTISLLTQGKSRFGISESAIQENVIANLSLFNPDIDYTFNESHMSSSSKNSAFKGMALKGETYGVIANNKIVLK
ncbi:MAG: dihydroorotase, partial [Winogradskyella sp.]|nr:dihydroorotase [Winogradskyella sp.]